VRAPLRTSGPQWGARLHNAGWCGYCMSYGRRRRSLDSIRRALWQGICGDRPGRHAAGGARQAHGPRDSVSCSAPPLSTATAGRAARRAYTLWWCAENVTETTSAARSAAGSARCRSSPSCKPSPLRTGVGAATYGGVVRVLHGTAGSSSTIHECCGHCLGWSVGLRYCGWSQRTGAMEAVGDGSASAMPSACYLRAGVGSTGTARGTVPEGSLDSIQSDALWWQGTGGQRPGRHAAGGARQAHGPRASVSCSVPPLGTAMAGRAARRAYTLRWFAATASTTSSAARSAAGSARWRSSPTCERPSAHGRGRSYVRRGGAGTARGMVGAAGASIRSNLTRCGRALGGNGLRGMLPAELGKLTDLERL
jgi:hypothetical protein